MTDQTMPWRTLAERLGFEVVKYDSGPVVYYRTVCHFLDGTDPYFEDLLIGRALRVAWEKNIGAPNVVATDWVWSAMTQGVTNNVGDERAVGCLRLLDAVGHQP